MRWSKQDYILVIDDICDQKCDLIHLYYIILFDYERNNSAYYIMLDFVP